MKPNILPQGQQATVSDHEGLSHLARQAELHLEEGEHARARKLAEQALNEALEGEDRGKLAYCKRVLSDCLFVSADFEQALYHAKNSLRHYLSIHDEVGIALASRAAGNALTRLGNYSMALQHYFSALAILERMDMYRYCTSVLNAIGLTYHHLDEHANALEFFHRALALDREHRNRQNESACLNNLGLALFAMNESEEALRHFRASLEIKRDFDDVEGIAACLHNIGHVYSRQKRYQEARRHIEESIDLYRKRGNSWAEAKTRLSLGDILRQSEQPDSARAEYERSVFLLRQCGDRRTLAETLCSMGALCAAGKNFGEAYALFAEAMNIAEQLGVQRLTAQICKELAGVYRLQGDYRKSLEMSERYCAIEQKVDSMARDRRVQSMHMMHQIERARTSAELERLKTVELKEKNQELATVNATLSELSQEKSEMLQIAAHDLKNPLASIAMEASLLRRYHDRFATQDERRHISIIETSAMRMTEIISKILDIDAIESGRLDLHSDEVCLTEVLREICLQYHNTAGKKDISLHCELGENTETIQGDRSSLAQIADNLISNAIKYSPPGSRVWVRSYADDNRAGFSVQDEGPGFSVEDKKRMFGKFVRLSARPTGGEHSTGLGLSIVKKLVDAHKGHVWCDSEAGKGATFCVSLPRGTENTPF